MTEMAPGHSMVLFPPQNRPAKHVYSENGSPPRTSAARSSKPIKLGLFALTAARLGIPWIGWSKLNRLQRQGTRSMSTVPLLKSTGREICSCVINHLLFDRWQQTVERSQNPRPSCWLVFPLSK